MYEPGSDLWTPEDHQIEGANVTAFLRDLGLADYDDLYQLSITRPDVYWEAILRRCGIKWSKPYDQFADFSVGREFPHWFVGGRLNWTDTIFAWARDPATADRIALVAENEAGQVEELTYAQLHLAVRRFAGGLRGLGIGKGDRVGLLMEPGAGAVISMLAVSYCGAMLMPLFSGFAAEPIALRLQTCHARALISTTGYFRRGKWIDRSADAIEATTRTGTEFLILRDSRGQTVAPGAQDWFALAEAEPLGPDAEPMSAQDRFMVFFTSGTTGKPKGIVHTHGGFPLKIVHDAHLIFDVKRDDVFFWPADMGWIAGALIVASTLMQGARMICYDGAPDMPDWSRMSRIIERNRVTHFGTAPTMIRGFAANADQATAGDVSSLRLLITGGEAVAPEHFLWHARAFGRGQAPLINYSGGTEASGCLVSSVIVKPIPPAGFNTVAPGISADVVAPDGTSLRNRLGELVVRDPFIGMTASFWEDDERYLDTYWRTIPGLWVHGDLAERDDAGNFFIRGRSDDTLKLAGKRTGPAEIEDVLTEVPGVTECAAVGIDDAAKGQVLVVFAVTDQTVSGTTDLCQAISLQADRRLGRAFRPAAVHLVRQLPKTRTAKVMRRLIRAAYSGLPLGDTSSLENPVALEEIAALRGTSHGQPDRPA